MGELKLARCSDCEKFVPFSEEPSIEIEDYFYEDGLVNIETNITLECEECGLALKEKILEFSEEHHCNFCSDEDFDPDLIEITDVEGEGYMRLDDHNGRRKTPLKFFGCSLTITLLCKKCNQQSVIEACVEAESKDFEEC